MIGRRTAQAMAKRGGWRAVGLVLAVALFVIPATGAAAGGETWVLVAWIGWPVTGAVVLFHLPRHRIGWLMVLIGALWGTFIFGVGASETVQAMPAAAEAVINAAGYAPWILMILVVALLPDGTARTRLARVVVTGCLVLLAALMIASVFGVESLATTGRANPLLVPGLVPFADALLGDRGFLLVPTLVILAAIDLFGKAWRSTGVQRAQYLWVLLGVGLTIGILVLGTLLPDYEGAIGSWVAAVVNAIPLCIGVAVLKYRLWDIDRIVSRTVSYALVTAGVLGVYALVVTSAARLLPESSTLAVALATLAAAAAFRPLLTRVRRVVDRRFDRARFDAVRESEEFAARLADAVDPDEVTADLATTIGRTLAPGSLAVWTGGSR